MVSQVEIIAKYKELYMDYSNMNIDDYEVFIRTRVIEYFYRLSDCSIDKLTSLINAVLEEEKINSTMVPRQKSIAMNEDVNKIITNQNISTMHDKTLYKKFCHLLKWIK